MSIYYSILYFFVYGFLGWCTEVIFAAFKQHRFVNRGFLNGPICDLRGWRYTGHRMPGSFPVQPVTFVHFFCHTGNCFRGRNRMGNGQAVPQQMVGLFQTAFQYRRVCLPFIFLDLGRCMRFHRIFCPPADPSGVIPDSAHSRNCFDRNPWHCSAFRYDRNHFCNREVQSISGTAEAYHRRITRNFQSDRSRALSECNARTGYAGKFQTKTG